MGIIQTIAIAEESKKGTISEVENFSRVKVNLIMASKPRRRRRVRSRRANSLPTNVLTKDNNKSWTDQDFNEYEEQLKAQLIILRSIVCKS